MSRYTDGEGRTWTVEHGLRGLATKITDPAGLVTEFERDGDGNATRTVLPSGHAAARTYDGAANVLTLTDETLGGTTEFTYDPVYNQVTSITDANQQTTTIAYL